MSANFITDGWPSVGPNMSANFVTEGSKYECKAETYGWNMSASFSKKKKIRVQSRKSRRAFLTLISGRITSKRTVQYLHLYWFPLRTVCTHIWALLLWSLHPYLATPIRRLKVRCNEKEVQTSMLDSIITH